jgi:hypothetical protein
MGIDIINNDININNARTYDNRMDTLSNSNDIDYINEKSIINETAILDNNTNINIYRFKFTHEFIDELYTFSKIHQYDHRKDFKEVWKIWLDDNECIVENEIRRIQNLGYNGDIKDKMFKSSRYYLRKKSTEKKEPVRRRTYVSVQKDLLDAIDQHIKNNIHNKSYKPSDGFDDFCNNNIDLLKQEINILIRNGFTDSEEIRKKMKKTYKNRHFLISK